MPNENQKVVTIPLSVWERYEEMYMDDPDKWRDLYAVRSVTGLMVYVLRREARTLELSELL